MAQIFANTIFQIVIIFFYFRFISDSKSDNATDFMEPIISKAKYCFCLFIISLYADRNCLFSIPDDRSRGFPMMSFLSKLGTDQVHSMKYNSSLASATANIPNDAITPLKSDGQDIRQEHFDGILELEKNHGIGSEFERWEPATSLNESNEQTIHSLKMKRLNCV